MTETKFIKRKKPNVKRIVILLILLVIILFLFFNIDTLLSGLFEVRE
jgi:hypothetical protein